ncbi:hypothetical protein ACTWKC_01560 [Bacillus sp. 4A_MP3]
MSKYAENDKSANTILLKAAKAPALITNRTLTGATNLVPFREIIRLALNRPINEPNASPNIINPAKTACEQSRRLFFLHPSCRDRRGR